MDDTTIKAMILKSSNAYNFASPEEFAAHRHKVCERIYRGETTGDDEWECRMAERGNASIAERAKAEPEWGALVQSATTRQITADFKRLVSDAFACNACIAVGRRQGGDWCQRHTTELVAIAARAKADGAS